jgi:formylglycine-generating enzyme required for sulfatase activity
MKYKLQLLAALGVLVLGNALANAEISIELTTVGDAGNANDSTGYGAVSYVYNIATKEVNLFQYTAFLNAVAATDTFSLYNTQLASDSSIAGISRSGSSGSYTYSVLGSGNRPVTYVSWFDATRFANWMANGQPTGAQGNATTENGAYTLTGAPGPGPTKNTVNPNTGAATTYWIPSESEWYKAAYYQPVAQGGDTDSYWLYPTKSNSIAGNTIGVSNSANYYDGDYARSQNSLPSLLTDGGAYGTNSASFYGTYDQGGNVFEWYDAVFGGYRRVRGGYSAGDSSFLVSSYRYFGSPTDEDLGTGFRVASVPEPSTAVMVVLTGAGWLMWRRGRVNRLSKLQA